MYFLLDIKSANIFITSNYQVKIGDLGLSYQLSEEETTVKCNVWTKYCKYYLFFRGK